MITRDKEIFEAKAAELCSIQAPGLPLKEDAFAEASEGASDRILIDLESTSGVEDLLAQIRSAYDSLQCIDRCEMIAYITLHGMFRKDDMSAVLNSLLGRIVSLVIYTDVTLGQGHFKLSQFLFVKDYGNFK